MGSAMLLNALAMGGLALQQAAGSLALADTLRSGSARYALVFTANTFLALGVATGTQLVATRCGASTRAYYWILVGMCSFLAAVAVAWGGGAG